MKPGPLALMPLADSWADGAGIELDVAPIVVMDGVVLTLRVGGRIEGFAFDEAGNPLVGRRVTWSATAMGMGSTKGVTPTMETGATLNITVEDPEGRLQRASLEVRDSDGRDVGGMRTVSARTVMFNEGFSTIEQRLGPPPPDHCTVRATLDDGRVVERGPPSAAEAANKPPNSASVTTPFERYPGQSANKPPQTPPNKIPPWKIVSGSVVRTTEPDTIFQGIGG